MELQPQFSGDKKTGSCCYLVNEAAWMLQCDQFDQDISIKKRAKNGTEGFFLLLTGSAFVKHQHRHSSSVATRTNSCYRLDLLAGKKSDPFRMRQEKVCPISFQVQF